MAQGPNSGPPEAEIEKIHFRMPRTDEIDQHQRQIEEEEEKEEDDEVEEEEEE